MNTGFERYPSLKRFGTTEVSGIEDGMVYIFPKLDGTNASVWLDDDGEVQAGSRNRHLDESSDGDNAGFCKWVRAQSNIETFLRDHENFRLYGEWLVPHTIKGYRDDAWRKLYVFDVYDMENEKFIPYDDYKLLLDQYEIEYIPALWKAQAVTIDKLLHKLPQNTYLMKDGEGPGEGLVVKNYEYVNRFDRVTWAKLVTNEFRERAVKEFGTQNTEIKVSVEEKIIEKYMTEAFIEKEYSKMVLNEEWSSKRVGELLGRVWHEFLAEEPVNFIKALKHPTVNFKVLNNLAIAKIKKVKGDLF
jgi:hypothetical protein